MEELPESAALVAQPCAPVGFEHVWSEPDLTAAFFTDAEQRSDGPIFSAFGYEWCLRIECTHAGYPYDPPYVAGVFQSPPTLNCGVWLVLLTSHAHVRVSLSFTLGNRVRHLHEVSLCTYSAEVRAGVEDAYVADERAGFPRFLPCNTLMSSPELYFPGGQMTVKVLLRACDVARCSPIAVQLPRFSEQWRSLLTSGRGADVTLVCEADDVKLAAHTVVLSVRSSVFAVKFSPDGSWATTAPHPHVMVPRDITSHTMQRLLEFLYTDELTLASAEEAQHLLHAATYYDLPGLRDICEIKLFTAINTENAAFTLTLAAEHGATKLKDFTLCWIAQRLRYVTPTEGWQHLVASKSGCVLMNAVIHTIGHGGPPILAAPRDSLEAAGGGDGAEGSKRPRE